MKFVFIFLLLLTSACEKDKLNGAVSDLNTLVPISDDGDSNSSPLTGVAEEYMKLVNDHRVSIGLDPLIYDEGVARIVQNHSDGMADGSVAFGHTGFSSRCSEARSELGGGNWCGENVAMGQKSAQAAFNAWMNSSGHRANIEKSQATHTGLGHAISENGTHYWTQIFIELN